MRTLLVLTLKVVAGLIFTVLGIAAFNIYSPIGAILFLAIVGGIMFAALRFLTTTFRTRDRARFIREYEARPAC